MTCVLGGREGVIRAASSPAQLLANYTKLLSVFASSTGRPHKRPANNPALTEHTGWKPHTPHLGPENQGNQIFKQLAPHHAHPTTP